MCLLSKNIYYFVESVICTFLGFDCPCLAINLLCDLGLRRELRLRN